MKTDRRNFLRNACTIGATGAVLPNLAFATLSNPVKTIVKPEKLFFDINETLLDLEPLKLSIVEILGGKRELATLWFTTMLQYSMVTSVSNQYRDFGAIGVATLLMVAKSNDIILTEEQAKKAVQPILSLKPHPEVEQSLSLLKNDGYKLVSFTNSSNYAVQQQLKNAKIDSFFDEQVSIEDFGKFKPEMTYNFFRIAV